MPLTRQEQQEEVGSSHGYTMRRAGLESGDSWRKRRGQAASRATTPGLQSPLLSPEFSLEKEGFGTEARQVEGHGVWAQGEGTTLEGHPLSLKAHLVFRSRGTRPPTWLQS